jgi:hypothetical protein
VLDHLDDLASDLSAIHGIRDLTELSGPAFFKLAHRAGSYQGVMRDVLTAEAQAAGGDTAGPAQPAQTAPPPGNGPRQVGGSRAELMAEPAFAGILSFGAMS